MKKTSIFLKGLLFENPVFVLILGTCPTLAVTQNLVSAIGMGISATIVLVCSNITISLLRNIIPDRVRIPSYIVIIAAFVTIVQLFLHAYLPQIYDMLGVYLALIIVNCIILGRAELFARKNTVFDSAVDGIGMGAGFTFALISMALIREILGSATVFGYDISFLKDYKITAFTAAPGGFFVFGLLIALVNKITKQKAEAVGCKGCPSADSCVNRSEEGCIS